MATLIQVFKHETNTQVGKGDGSVDTKAGTALVDAWERGKEAALTVGQRYKLKISGKVFPSARCVQVQVSSPVATFDALDSVLPPAGEDDDPKLPDFAALVSDLESLGSGIADLVPKVKALESKVASAKQLAPAAGQSLSQDLSVFSGILGDVIEVTSLLAKIKVLEDVFDFDEVGTELQTIQSQIHSLATQSTDLDHEIATVNTLFGQLDDPTQQLSEQVSAVAEQIRNSWISAYQGVPALFTEAEQANKQQGGKLGPAITKAASVYASLISVIQPVLADMKQTTASSASEVAAVAQAITTLGSSGSSLDQTRQLLANADSLLETVDEAKSKFDLLGQLVKPLEGILTALGALVTGQQQLNPADPSTKQSIDQAVSTLLPIKSLLEKVEATVHNLQGDVNTLQRGQTTFSKSTSALLAGAAKVSQEIQLSAAAQTTLQDLASAVAKASAEPDVNRLLAREPGSLRRWTADALRHVIEVLRSVGNRWLSEERRGWSAVVAGQTYRGSLEPTAVGVLADSRSVDSLAMALAEACDAGLYTDPYQQSRN